MANPEHQPSRNPRERRAIWTGWTNLEKASAFFFSLAILSTLGALSERGQNNDQADNFAGEIILFGVIAASLLVANEIRGRNNKTPRP